MKNYKMVLNTLLDGSKQMRAKGDTKTAKALEERMNKERDESLRI